MITRFSKQKSNKNQELQNELFQKYLSATEARIRTDIWKLAKKVSKLESKLKDSSQNHSSS